MKKNSLLIISALVFLLQIHSAFASPPGWTDDIRVTVDPFGPVFSGFPKVAVGTDDKISLVWQDTRDFNPEIFYKKLNTDGSVNVGETRLTTNPGISFYPSLAVDSLGNVHIVWMDDRDGNGEIYYTKLDQNGLTVVDDTPITSTANIGDSSLPSIAVDSNNNLHVVWVDTRDGNAEIYYRKFLVSGVSVTPLTSEIRITTDPPSSPAISWQPVIAIDSNNNVHIIWTDDRNGDSEIYYTKLDNSGNFQIYPNNKRITNNPGDSSFPSIGIDTSNNLHLAWMDDRHSNYEIYYKKLDNNGGLLISDTRLTDDPSFSWFPSISIYSNGNVHIAWTDRRDGNPEIYFTKLYNNGITVTDDKRLTFDSADSYLPSVAVAGDGNTHIFWEDSRDGNPEIYYKHLTTPVLLVHGIYSSDQIWGDVENVLQAQGIDYFRVGQAQNPMLSTNFPGLTPNNGDIRNLALQVGTAIQNIKANTGANKVNVVAHSLGGLATRWYIRGPFYQQDINKLITLGTPNEGAPVAAANLAEIFGFTLGGGNSIFLDTARTQMIPNSDFLNELNSNFSTHGVQHTEIAGTGFNPNLIPYAPLIYAIYYNVFRPSDTIVPRSSVNIPNIQCYQREGVAHTDVLSGIFIFSYNFIGTLNVYYRDSPTINAVINILKGQPVSLESCPSESGDSSGQEGNSVQIASFSGIINPGQTQTLLSDFHPGNRFSAVLNWSSSQGQIGIQITTPSGNVVNSSTVQNTQNISFSNGSGLNMNFEFLSFEIPEQGSWGIAVRGQNISSSAAYSLYLFTEKNISADLNSDRATYTPNESAILTVRVENNTAPVLNSTVLTRITKPDSSVSEVVLFDDGNHNDGNASDGIYGNSFSETASQGIYLVEANASQAGLFQIGDLKAIFVELFPDITPLDISVPSSINFGSSVSINSTVKNIGSAPAENITVLFYDGDPQSGALIGNITIPQLAVNQTAVASADWTPSQLGGHSIFVAISPFNGFVDANYSNDVISETVTVAGTGGNTPPVLNPIGNQEVVETQILTMQLQATDPENDTLTFGTNAGSVLPSPFFFNETTGLFQWTPTLNDQGNYSVTFNVTDGNLSDNETILITVLDAQTPSQLIWSQTNNPSAGNDWANGVAADSTGVYTVGFDESLGNSQWRMEKRNLSDGSLIWTQTSNPSTESDGASRVAVDSSGLYIVGYDSSLGNLNAQWRMEKRSLSDGSLIWTQTSNPSSGRDAASGVGVDTSGVYIVGYDDSLGYPDRQWRIEKRSLTDGSLIWTQTSNPSGGDDRAYGVGVDSTGVYIVGVDVSPGGSNTQWRMEKRSLSDGSLIWTQTSNPSNRGDEANGVAVDSTGVYIAGSDSSLGELNPQWHMEKRNLSDGSLIWNQTSNPSISTDYAYGVAVGNTGVYIAGVDSSPGNYQWRMEKRSLSDGSLILSQTSNPSGGDDLAYGVAVDSTGVYIAGSDSSPSNPQWRMEKRFGGNSPPILQTIGNRTVFENSTLTIQLNATDPDNDTLIFSTNAASVLPSSFSFSQNTGLFQWTPTFNDSGNYSVTFSVSDGNLSDSETIIIAVNNVNQPPAISPILPMSRIASLNVTINVSATDPENGALVYFANDTRFAPNPSLPNIFTWETTANDKGNFTVLVTVSDGEFNVSQVVEIEVRDILECGKGTANANSGSLFNSLLISGSAGNINRTVHISLNTPFNISILASPSGPSPAQYVLYAVAGTPVQVAESPFGVGVTCFKNPFQNEIPLLTVLNTFGFPSVIGYPLFPGSQAPFTLTIPAVPVQTTVTLQGFIADFGSPSFYAPLSVTNGIILEIS